MATRLSQADFPGYAEAVARERLIRATACLGGQELICGIDVMPLTSRHIRWLAFVNSPFLLRGVSLDELCAKPDIDRDIMLFLWLVSPLFKSGAIRRRNRFYKRSFKVIGKLAVNIVVKEIVDYIDEAYLDAGQPSGEEKSYYAFEVSIVTSLHRTYGLPIDFWETGWLRNLVRCVTGKPSPLDVPLKIFWQLQKAERRHNDPDFPLSNASCKVLADGLTRINRLNEYLHDLAKMPCSVPESPMPRDLSGSEYGLS